MLLPDSTSKIKSTLLFGLLAVTTAIMVLASVQLSHSTVSAKTRIQGASSLLPTYAWTKAWISPTVGSGSSWGDNGTTDSNGNVYVLGTYQGTNLDFNPGAGQDLHTSANSGTAASPFLIKFDNQGNYQWGYDLPLRSGNFTIAVSTVTNEVSLIKHCGASEGVSVDFDPTSGTDSKVCHSLMLIMLGTDGTYKRGITYEAGLGSRSVKGFQYDSLGNLYIFSHGTTMGDYDFDFTTGTDLINTGSDSGLFISKVGPGGTYGGTTVINTSGASFYASALNIDQNNNITYSGTFQGTADLNPGTGVDQFTSNQNTYAWFMTSLASNGTYRWSKYLPAGGPSTYSLLNDTNGNYYAVSFFNSAYVADPDTNLTLTPRVSRSVSVAKYTSTGTFAWAKRFDGSGNSAAITSAGDVLVGGYWWGTWNFDPDGTHTFTDNSAWGCSMFINALDTDGNYLWTRITTGGNETDDYGISITGNNLYMIGDVFGTANYDPNGTNDMISGEPDGGAVTLTKYTLAAAEVTPTPTPTVTADAPTVTTTAQIPAYGATTAQVLGNVTADGGATVTERGVVYSSTNNTPTTSDSKQTVTGTTGAMTVQLSGLTPYTTYYVRAYATNSAGTGYGAVVTFRTIPMTLQNVYFTFGKLQYGKYAAPSTVKAGDTIYLKNYDPKKIQLLAISLYDYTTKGNQCYTRSWLSTTSMSMRTCGLLPTKRKYAFIFTFKDVATGVTVKKYFVINTISAGTITL